MQMPDVNATETEYSRTSDFVLSLSIPHDEDQMLIVVYFHMSLQQAGHEIVIWLWGSLYN